MHQDVRYDRVVPIITPFLDVLVMFGSCRIQPFLV